MRGLLGTANEPEKSNIYIAQPPLYRVKKGKSEQYMDNEEQRDRYLLELAVDEACSLLLAPTPLGGLAVTSGDIDCRFGVAPDGLKITVRARAPQGARS